MEYVRKNSSNSVDRKITIMEPLGHRLVTADWRSGEYQRSAGRSSVEPDQVDQGRLTYSHPRVVASLGCCESFSFSQQCETRPAQRKRYRLTKKRGGISRLELCCVKYISDVILWCLTQMEEKGFRSVRISSCSKSIRQCSNDVVINIDILKAKIVLIKGTVKGSITEKGSYVFYRSLANRRRLDTSIER